MSDKTQQMSVQKTSFLKNPLVVFGAMVAGIFLGFFLPETAKVLRPIGVLFLSLLSMTVIPIIISAIISSIAGLVRLPRLGRFVRKLILFLLLGQLFCSILGVLTGFIGNPGEFSNTEMAQLGNIIDTAETSDAMYLSLDQPVDDPVRGKIIVSFLEGLIPGNIFVSLTEGLALQIVFFSILMGVTIGLISDRKSNLVLMFFNGFFQAFQKIIGWVMNFLPFGLFSLVAYNVATTGIETMLVMIRFIVLFYVVGFLVVIIDTIIIWLRSRSSFPTVAKSFLNTILIALVTRNSFATIPSCIEAMSEKLYFKRNEVNLLVPLGITLGRFGNILYFGLASIFVVQLYNFDMTLLNFLIITLAAVFAGLATSGSTGFATLSLLSIVLSPLGLPVEAVLIILIAIDAVVDPMRTLLIVHVNLAVNACLASVQSKEERELRNRRKGDRRISSHEFS